MIEAKNIRLEGKIISLEYKYELNEEYESLSFNIDTFNITNNSNKVDEHTFDKLYIHLMKPLSKMAKNKELKSEFISQWY